MKRSKKSKRAKPAVVAPTMAAPAPAPTSSSNNRRWRRPVLAALILIAAGVAGVVFLPRPPSTPAAVPVIALTGLAPEAASLIQTNLDEVRRSPGNGDAWGRLGGILKSCGLPREAEVCLAEAERLSPKDPRWPYLRGTLPGDDVIRHLRRAAALAGRKPEMPRLRLARALIEAGQAAEARTVAAGVLRDSPDCLPARLLLAQIHQANSEWRQAVEQASLCVDSPTTGRAAGTLLAVAHQRLGDTAAAEQAARQTAARPPDVSWPDLYEEEVLGWRNDPRSLSDRAQSHLVAGRIETAMPLIERLVRNYPAFAETWLLLGRAQYLRKQPAEAEVALRRHLELEPTSVNGYFQLGMSQLAQQKLAEAAAAFRQAIALKADFGPAYFNLGFALAKMGQTREAVEPFRQAVRHNPEKVDTYILLADLHVQLGELGEATRLADLAERLDPGDRRLPSLRKKIGR